MPLGMLATCALDWKSYLGQKDRKSQGLRVSFQPQTAKCPTPMTLSLTLRR